MAPKATSTTPQSSSVLDDLRALESRVTERIRELEPYAQELTDLRATAERLGIDPAAVADKPRSAAPKRTAAKPSRTAAATGRRRRRAARGGQSRAEQVLEIVKQQPGVTIPALGQALGVDSTGLYRVVRGLQADGLIRKDGRQLQPVAEQGQPVSA